MSFKELLRGFLILLVAGVVFLLISVPIFLRTIEIRNNSSETTATVTYVGRTSRSRFSNGDPILYAQYVVNGVDYSSRVFFRPEGSFNVSDEVQIYYSLRNPSNARLADPIRARNEPHLIPLILGAFLTTLSVWAFYLCIRTWKTDRKATKRITDFRRE